MNTKEKTKKIPRPLNAFMLFANDHRQLFRNENPGEKNSRISIRLGEAWKQLNGKEKTKYYQLSKKAEIDHRNKYPDYIYCPKDARKEKKSRLLSRATVTDGQTAAISPGSEKSTSSSSLSSSLSSPVEISPPKSEEHNGQGDHAPVSFSHLPHYMPPFGFPRYPFWGHSYLPPQYGRMPFMPHPLMYQYPPLHFPLPPTVDADRRMNFFPYMGGYYQYPQPASGQEELNVPSRDSRGVTTVSQNKDDDTSAQRSIPIRQGPAEAETETENRSQYSTEIQQPVKGFKTEAGQPYYNNPIHFTYTLPGTNNYYQGVQSHPGDIKRDAQYKQQNTGTPPESQIKTYTDL